MADLDVKRIPERLETDRLLLRRLRHEDAEEIFYTYASKPECTKFVAWPTHQSIQDTREYLSRTMAGWEQGLDFSYSIRLLANNRFIGGCGFLEDEGKIQIGYVLGPIHWRKGYATEAVGKLIEMLRGIPGVLRVGSFVDADNLASARVLKKAGLVEEAVLKNWFRFPNQGNVSRDCILFRLPD